MAMIERLTADSPLKSSALALLAAQYVEHDIVLAADRMATGIDGVLADGRRGAIFMAVDESGAALGMAALTFAWSYEAGGEIAWLEELYVVPAHRGAGLGRVLVDFAIAFATNAGLYALHLEVTSDHRRAEHLYDRAGFEPMARSRWVKKLVAR